MQNQLLKTCFVSAPSGMRLDELRESLIAHGIRPLLPEDLQSGTDWASEIQQQLIAADLVIGVLPSARQSQWVLFELGQAWALGKRILLIASPKVKALPFSLQRTVVLRIEPGNRQALDFALDQFLSAPPESKQGRTRSGFERKALGAQADVLLARLSEWEHTQDPSVLEQVAADALREAGTDVVSVSPSPDRGADIAVWSDVLEPFVGNPMLVEVKNRIENRSSAKHALTQLNSYLGQSGARWALLLYAEGPDPSDTTRWGTIPVNVLVMRLHTFIEALRDRAFPEVIRDLRNDRVHGVKP